VTGLTLGLDQRPVAGCGVPGIGTDSGMCAAERRVMNRWVIEFAGPLGRDRLRLELDGRDVDPDGYYPDGGHPAERCVLEHRLAEWVACYSERGPESGLRSFATKDLACRHPAHATRKL
jgi:hypothetical protein